MERKFDLVSEFLPTGDQPEAIAQLVQGFNDGSKAFTLKGVTGSGKTYTMANIIQQLQRPVLVMAHNKTLAGQLWAEFKAFFPENAVEYFVSYYDYYQPEAYMPTTDTYIEKDSSINEEIDRMRHSATASLLERRDVIVVASVSCIYGLGDPEDYAYLMVNLRPGMRKDRDQVIEDLVKIQYTRNDFSLQRGNFRVRGDILDVFSVQAEHVITRISFFGNEIERITEIEAISGKVICDRNYTSIFPASHYATTTEKAKRALVSIEKELDERLLELHKENKLLEAYRLEQRTRYDMAMLKETGSCKGIENYSRHMSGRAPGSPPFTLLDFFPKDFLLFVDESHVTVPQIGAMYNGDRARKESLVNYGFRLPSAFDNRPLKMAEFERKIGQTLFVSATPAQYEKAHSEKVVEQIIRPTGLLDPEISIHPIKGQIEALISMLQETVKKRERALVLTLTKKMAEDLTTFLQEEQLKVEYLHSEIKTVERLEILRDLRQGKFDILVGINLLREGLDLPEVSLIAILDADKEGFLRSTTSLIQIIGRAARHVNGKVVLFADEVTNSMYQAISETNRRREIQEAYNTKHQITPTSIQKEVRDVVDSIITVVAEAKKDTYGLDQEEMALAEQIFQQDFTRLKQKELDKLEKQLNLDMEVAAKKLAFEEAASLRDALLAVRGEQAERRKKKTKA